MNSEEYHKLMRVNHPTEEIRAGDMFMMERLKSVIVALGVKREKGRNKGKRLWAFLYHFHGVKSLSQSRQYWDKNLYGCSTIDEVLIRGDEKYKYVGNLFDFIPHETLVKRMYRT